LLTRLFGIGFPGERADRMAAAEPAVTTAGYSGMTVKAPKPHAALLFLDFLHPREGQQGIMKGGLWSPRETSARSSKNSRRFASMKNTRSRNWKANFPNGRV
jgi:ABC-type Fe3+ transport system substrate-binding protein